MVSRSDRAEQHKTVVGLVLLLLHCLVSDTGKLKLFALRGASEEEKLLKKKQNGHVLLVLFLVL